jgi:alkyl hydroperoxide reductase subunit AhpC
VLRVIDSLQLTASHQQTTAAQWQPVILAAP